MMITKRIEIPKVSATSRTDFFTKIVLSKAMFSLMSLGKSFCKASYFL